MTDFETFFLDHRGEVFRYWVYKRMFTPYEQAEKFMDETCFVDSTASHGYIEEAVELPDGDILLGFVDPNLAEEDVKYVDYHKLSEIQLAWCELDAVHDDEEDDLDEE